MFPTNLFNLQTNILIPPQPYHQKPKKHLEWPYQPNIPSNNTTNNQTKLNKLQNHYLHIKTNNFPTDTNLTLITKWDYKLKKIRNTLHSRIRMGWMKIMFYRRKKRKKQKKKRKMMMMKGISGNLKLNRSIILSVSRNCVEIVISRNHLLWKISKVRWIVGFSMILSLIARNYNSRQVVNQIRHRVRIKKTNIWTSSE